MSFSYWHILLFFFFFFAVRVEKGGGLGACIAYFGFSVFFVF
jgi:hypothetical protein